MSRAVIKEVKQLLHGIDALGDDARMVFEQEFAKKLEKEWVEEAGKARKTARRKKIDQKTIDLAIERGRYGG